MSWRLLILAVVWSATVSAMAQDKYAPTEFLACEGSKTNPATPKMRVSRQVQLKNLKRYSAIAVPPYIFDAISAKHPRIMIQTNEDGVPFCVGFLKDSDEPDKSSRLGLNQEQRMSFAAAVLEKIRNWEFAKTYLNGKSVVIEFSAIFEKNKKKKLLELVRD